VAISGTYIDRLRTLDDENLERVSSNADGRSYARLAAKIVTLQWWAEVRCFRDVS
jgi:hypothetical protein